jgi:nucleotide-binding universal stress UspA family protein
MKKILVGFDGSENSFKALAEALNLAKKYDASIEAVSVEEVPRFADTIGELVEEKKAEDGRYGVVLKKAREMAKSSVINMHFHVIVGHEVKTIVEYIKKHNHDLLVVGFMGHSAIYDRVMGSTCQGLVRLAPCSVLVVK